jgi:spore coat polysaccharide biosynthesis protein SpsF
VTPAIIITARLGSSRLPRKVLTPLCGRPALERMVERMREARLVDRIVLCTTTEPEDAALEQFAGGVGIEAFRGDPDDILVRWRDAAHALGIDFLVTCDGDDVFCDAAHVDRVVECHNATGADYVSCAGLPFGAAPTGYTRAALDRVCALKSDTHTEGQARFFQDRSLVSHAEVTAPGSVRHDEARMTLDYPDDVRFFEAVIEELEQPDRVFTLEEIVALLRERPDIVALNSGLQEEYWRRFNERYKPVDLGTA